MPKAVFADFLAKARNAHGNRYDYSQSNTFVNYQSVITILCLTHGAFRQTAGNHAHKGNGCGKCNKTKCRTEDFIQKATKVHGDKWDYSQVCYERSKDKVQIGCAFHGYFWQTPESHIHQQAGCHDCADLARSHTKARTDFVELAKALHEDTFDYSQVQYQNQYQEVKIVCPKHGVFEQLPKLHLKGCGCPKCAKGRSQQAIRDAAATSFEDRCKQVHGEKYDYSQVKYVGCHDPVEIGCPEHGTFTMKAIKHSQGQPCPKCSTAKTYSEKACDWLDWLAANERITIQHGRNNDGKEFKIPGTMYKADGYCLETGVLYEFYGDFWHGNPNRYDRGLYNQVCKVTMGELYDRTKHRQTVVERLGFTVVVVWEKEWDEMCRP